MSALGLPVSTRLPARPRRARGRRPQPCRRRPRLERRDQPRRQRGGRKSLRQERDRRPGRLHPPPQDAQARGPLEQEPSVRGPDPDAHGRPAKRRRRHLPAAQPVARSALRRPRGEGAGRVHDQEREDRRLGPAAGRREAEGQDEDDAGAADGLARVEPLVRHAVELLVQPVVTADELRGLRVERRGSRPLTVDAHAVDPAPANPR